jgi:hypothetical protein
MRSGCRRITSVVKWCPWYICQTHGFKLHPHAPKKFMGHGISHTYTGTQSACYFEKICKCSRQYFRECDESVTNSNTVTLRLLQTSLHHQMSLRHYNWNAGRSLNLAWRFRDKMHNCYSIPRYTCRSFRNKKLSAFLYMCVIFHAPWIFWGHGDAIWSRESNICTMDTNLRLRLSSGTHFSWLDSLAWFNIHTGYWCDYIPKFPKDLREYKKIEKSNSASLCKFRPVGHNSITTTPMCPNIYYNNKLFFNSWQY